MTVGSSSRRPGQPGCDGEHGPNRCMASVRASIDRDLASCLRGGAPDKATLGKGGGKEKGDDFETPIVTRPENCKGNVNRYGFITKAENQGFRFADDIVEQ